MVKTLQDMLNAVGAHPERYGTLAWFTEEGEPWCPLSVEILTRHGIGPCGDTAEYFAAAQLALEECTAEDLGAFLTWWDWGPIHSRWALEKRGYIVPPDDVRARRRKRHA